MTGYLVRRFVQMAFVLFFSAVASYTLLNFAPGGPLQFLTEIVQGGGRRITEDDVARIRSYFELDLILPVRFTRWFIGQPRGPIEIGGTTIKVNEKTDLGTLARFDFTPDVWVGLPVKIKTYTDDKRDLAAASVEALVTDANGAITDPECAAGSAGGEPVLCGNVSSLRDLGDGRFVVLDGQTYFEPLIVGCRKPIEEPVKGPDGEITIETVGCKEYVTLRDLEVRRTSNGVLFGDFGLSWQILRDRPVSLIIMSRLWRTLQLMSAALIISLIVGVPVGIFSAVRQYSRFDYTLTTLSFVGSSMPTFLSGILMILFFGLFLKNIGLPFLPVGNAVGVKDYVIPWLGQVEAGSLLDNFLRMLMPTGVLVLFTTAGWTRYVRSSMLEVMRQDYVRTARAKGLLENVVITKHALRNALIPFSTILMLSIPGLFGGAIVTESVFNWPGMGRLYYDALGRTDWPVAMALLFITAELTVVATLVSDIMYTVIDPRIKFS